MAAFLLRTWTGIALLLVSVFARGQAPTWKMAQAINNLSTTTGSMSAIEAMAADNQGNLYVAGEFRGTVQLGSTTLTNTSYPIQVFVAKWSPTTGTYVWAQPLDSGTGQQSASGPHVLARAIAISGSSVYVASTAFIAKLADAGTTGSVTWLQPVGHVGALAVDGSHVYIADAFQENTLNFGQFTVTKSLPAVGIISSTDLYVARLTDAGSSASFDWVQQAQGNLAPAYSEFYSRPSVSLAIIGNNVYVAGQLVTGTTTFGSGSLTSTASQGFLAKLTDTGTAGSFAWAANIGGAGRAQPLCLVAHNSSLYLAGIFFGTNATFGNTTLTQTGGSIAGNTGDAFIAKLNDTSLAPSYSWALRAGGTERDSASTLVAVGNRLYVAGRFSSPSLQLGSLTLTNANQQAPSYLRTDMYVAKITETDTEAHFAWAQAAGGNGYDSAYGLAAGASSLYVAGFIGNGTAAFGSLSLNSNVGNLETGFIASLSDQALPTRSSALQAGLALYPNPAHGVATVRVPAGAGPATLTLLDALGRVVRTTSAPAGADYPLGLAGMAPGLYTLRVQAGEALATQQLAVE